MSIVQTSNFVVPSDPVIRKKIADMVQLVSNSYTKIAAEKDLIKETIAELSKEHEIPKAYLNKVARIYHKGSIDAVTADAEAVETLYQKLFTS